MGEESYTLGKNLPYVSFQKFDDDGQKNRELIPYTIVSTATTYGTNISHLNYAISSSTSSQRTLMVCTTTSLRLNK